MDFRGKGPKLEIREMLRCRSFARSAAAAVALSIGCAQPPRADSAPSTAARPAPWSSATLARGAVARVFATQWQAADNRASCGLLAPVALGEGQGATPRAATFSGGWAVAYDSPDVRSAFGIAGTGSLATDPSYDAWPLRQRWADGSTAGYGPEGGTGPNQLAYLRIAGQRCLYNVWSRLGQQHLEYLLQQLRFVDLSNR